MKTKKCTNCGETKPIEVFYKRAYSKDGYYHICKLCLNLRNRLNSRKNYDPSKINKISPEARARNNRRMREKYPEKYKARIIYRSALNGGKIEKKPCEVCGELKVEGHHGDYSKPLDVRWLCKKHHSLVHRKETPPLKLGEVRQRKVSLDEIITLLKEGMKQIEIARKFKVTRQHIHNVLAPTLTDLQVKE